MSDKWKRTSAEGETPNYGREKVSIDGRVAYISVDDPESPSRAAMHIQGDNREGSVTMSAGYGRFWKLKQVGTGHNVSFHEILLNLGENGVVNLHRERILTRNRGEGLTMVPNRRKESILGEGVGMNKLINDVIDLNY